ncbi:putative calcium-binding protein CML45 [Senna tora]|uniref:Putative calcium-binding protein CML45 n=1 Tax=Senna tora TaxID=362788 RepID=A0A834VYP2_9FABA|nr:putative calcium-binding protein CML45 [Senna tora]
MSSPSSNPKAIRLVKQVSDCECELSKQEILCHGGREEEEEEEEDDDDDGKIVDRDEVEMVMGKLGLFCSPESEELKEGYGFNEICGVFDEEEARLEEVKEAFDVFDENRDGFIDAGELQRVLCVLGLKEATEMENCHKMIARFDENGDGRIEGLLYFTFPSSMLRPFRAPIHMR